MKIKVLQGSEQINGKDHLYAVSMGHGIDSIDFKLDVDKIKEGDLCINLLSGSIFKVLEEVDSENYKVDFITGGNIGNNISIAEYSLAQPKVIIATTDKSLNLPLIPQNYQYFNCGPYPIKVQANYITTDCPDGIEGCEVMHTKLEFVLNDNSELVVLEFD